MLDCLLLWKLMDNMEEFKIGETVKWCWNETHRNTYTIVDISNSGVILKQNFGIGTILEKRIPICEIKK
jgi:hypothetical protein